MKDIFFTIEKLQKRGDFTEQLGEEPLNATLPNTVMSTVDQRKKKPDIPLSIEPPKSTVRVRNITPASFYAKSTYTSNVEKQPLAAYMDPQPRNLRSSNNSLNPVNYQTTSFADIKPRKRPIIVKHPKYSKDYYQGDGL